MCMWLAIVASLFLVYGFGSGAVLAQSSQADQGRALLTKNCARCHGVAPDEKSRHQSAPTFTEIMKRYRAEMLAEALAEGLTTGHPDMPQFSFEPDEVAAIVRYLDTISK